MNTAHLNKTTSGRPLLRVSRPRHDSAMLTTPGIGGRQEAPVSQRRALSSTTFRVPSSVPPDVGGASPLETAGERESQTSSPDDHLAASSTAAILRSVVERQAAAPRNRREEKAAVFEVFEMIFSLACCLPGRFGRRGQGTLRGRIVPRLRIGRHPRHCRCRPGAVDGAHPPTATRRAPSPHRCPPQWSLACHQIQTKTNSRMGVFEYTCQDAILVAKILSVWSYLLLFSRSNATFRRKHLNTNYRCLLERTCLNVMRWVKI